MCLGDGKRKTEEEKLINKLEIPLLAIAKHDPDPEVYTFILSYLSYLCSLDCPGCL